MKACKKLDNCFQECLSLSWGWGGGKGSRKEGSDFEKWYLSILINYETFSEHTNIQPNVNQSVWKKVIVILSSWTWHWNEWGFEFLFKQDLEWTYAKEGNSGNYQSKKGFVEQHRITSLLFLSSSFNSTRHSTSCMTVLRVLPHHNSIWEKNLYEREIFILIFQSLKVFACTQSLCNKLSFQYHISGRMVLRKAKKCRRKLFILFQYKRDNFFAAVVITRVNRGNVFFHIIEPMILHRLALMVVEKWRLINSGM